MNIIKDIGPPVEDFDAGTGGSKRAKTEKQVVQKPWGKKETKVETKDVSDSISANSSVLGDDDKKEVEAPKENKKISSATKKRLEALKNK